MKNYPQLIWSKLIDVGSWTRDWFIPEAELQKELVPTRQQHLSPLVPIIQEFLKEQIMEISILTELWRNSCIKISHTETAVKLNTHLPYSAWVCSWLQWEPDIPPDISTGELKPKSIHPSFQTCLRSQKPPPTIAITSVKMQTPYWRLI